LSFDDVVALGRQLADSLDSHDSLGRWMAHYIADLINRVEIADNSDRDKLQRECATEILRLWSHRHSFRNPGRPMASFEPIYRALARLDPENPPWSYLRGFDRDIAPTAEQLAINAVLKAALAIDDTARDAVRELIVRAAKIASQAEAKWLEFAKQIEDEESGFVKVFNRLGRGGGGLVGSEDQADGDDATKSLEALAAACSSAREAVELHREPRA
jgi:hypothetical protein